MYLIPSYPGIFFDLHAFTHEISGTLTDHFGIMKLNSITLNILNSFYVVFSKTWKVSENHFIEDNANRPYITLACYLFPHYNLRTLIPTSSSLEICFLLIFVKEAVFKVSYFVVIFENKYVFWFQVSVTNFVLQ
jgi:hypothetical protein